MSEDAYDAYRAAYGPSLGLGGSDAGNAAAPATMWCEDCIAAVAHLTLHEWDRDRITTHLREDMSQCPDCQTWVCTDHAGPDGECLGCAHQRRLDELAGEGD